MTIFDKPTADWTLRELQVGAAVVTAARDVAVDCGDHECATRLQALSLVLAQERDNRERLIRKMDIAAADGIVRVVSSGLYRD